MIFLVLFVILIFGCSGQGRIIEGVHVSHAPPPNLANRPHANCPKYARHS